MKTYSQHNCQKRHRNYRTFAQCVFHYALWIAGTGQFASVSRCPHSGPGWRKTTVILHQTPAAAFMAREVIDRNGCGGQCQKDHEVICLSMDNDPKPEPKASRPYPQVRTLSVSQEMASIFKKD
jgi:hypothetical protein